MGPWGPGANSWDSTGFNTIDALCPLPLASLFSLAALVSTCSVANNQKLAPADVRQKVSPN